MDIRALILIVVTVLPTIFCGYNLKNSGNCPNLKNSLGTIRKRRHLAFPTGAAVSLATSAVKAFMTHVPSGWFFVIEVEMIYKLPDAEFVAAQKRRKLQHRQKRELWELLQTAIDQRNMNGRSCILRTICEAQIFLAPKGKSLVHDILRSIFTTPLHDKDFIEEIGSSYNELTESDYCEKINDCPFSFLSFVLELNKQA